MSAQKHLVFLVDGTGSMGSFLDALRDDVLPQSIEMARLMGGADLKIHCIVYRDYDVSPVVQQCIGGSERDLQAFIKRQKPHGGADTPEATKTGFNALLDSFAKSDHVLVCLFTDAPPHHALTGSTAIGMERAALKTYRPGFNNNDRAGFDWIDICRELHARQIPVYSILSRSCALHHDWSSFYLMAACAACGAVVCLPDTRADTITRVTIDVLMQAMGEQTASADKLDRVLIVRYAQPCNLAADGELHGKNENDTGFLPHRSLVVPHEQAPFAGSIAALDWLGQQLHSLPARLKSDAALRDTCFAVFDKLFTPQRVLCLTYNALFGKVWRMMCHFRDDARLPPLRDALSQCVGKLAENDRNALRAWIDASYDQTEEITALVHSAPRARPYYMLDGGVGSGKKPSVERKDLLSLATAPSRGVLQEVQRILCGVICIGDPQQRGPSDDDNANSNDDEEEEENEDLPVDDQGVPHFIPCSLDSYRVFAMLAHLVYPGVMFTLRPAAIVASLALFSGNAILKERASEFLTSIKGKWLNLPATGEEEEENKFDEVPELLSVEYIKLMRRIADVGMLTEREAAFYAKLFQLWRVRCAARKVLTVRVGFTPQLRDATLDVKLRCKTCKQRRSWTLMCADDECGLCKAAAVLPAGSAERIRLDGFPEPLQGDDDNNDGDGGGMDKSRMVECRTCCALYAVIDTAALRVEPKCHYCRSLIARVDADKSKTGCVRCRNVYVTPSGSKRDYMCAVCVQRPDSAIVEREVTLVDLMKEDAKWSSVALSMPLETAQLLLESNESFYKMYTKKRETLFATTALLGTTATGQTTLKSIVLRYNGKPIVDVDAVLATLREVIERGDLSDECALCFEPRAVNALEPVCGGQCNNRVCGSCASSWWGQVVPGEIVLPSHLTCPFCKQVPKAQTLRKHNRAACAIVARKTLQLDGAHWFAWCKQCYEISAAVPRECAVAQPTLHDYVCQKCVDARNAARDNSIAPPPAMQCPSCGHATIKDGGCNHIHCICGAHWCYQCGEQSDDIYEHMMEAHGNYGY